MAIRLPSSPVLSFHSSIASATTDAATVLLPQDTDSITVMLSSSVFGITTLNTYVQTSVDGGTTWLDMGNMGVMTATTGATPANALQNPIIATFSTVGSIDPTGTTSVTAVGSVVNKVYNKIGASVTAAGTSSGLPIMGRNLRIFHQATGTGASDIFTQVFVQNQNNRT